MKRKVDEEAPNASIILLTVAGDCIGRAPLFPLNNGRSMHGGMGSTPPLCHSLLRMTESAEFLGQQWNKIGPNCRLVSYCFFGDFYGDWTRLFIVKKGPAICFVRRFVCAVNSKLTFVNRNVLFFLRHRCALDSL